VPLGEDHLVVQAFRRAVTELGLPQPNLSMQCHNRIPHGQGLGSSAAAVVAGILAARALLADEQKFPDRQVLQLGAEFEGHPDNAAPALYGGPVVAWRENLEYQALPLKLSPKVKATLLVPETVLATKTARAALPGEVPHRDAAFNVSRAALLVAALAEHPELLLPATADKLHQDYRAHAMPASAALLDQLRALGVPALISGAGPTVLVLGSLDYSGTIAKLLQTSDFGTWRVLQPGLDRKGAIVTRLFPN
jgi:homoserine kinase